MATGMKYCEPEGPIIDFFKILISSDVKEMTILTNTQLLEILEKDFYIDTAALHALEIDIYISVLKKFLKVWPGWGNFDRIINKIKITNDKEVIGKILKKEYIKLKGYIQNLLNITQELAGKNIEDFKEKENLDKEDIVMEVKATRQQLNNLFYRHPIKDNIFNASKDKSQKLKSISLESVINSYSVVIQLKFKINDQYVIYERYNPHRLKHTLVNKKLDIQPHNDIELDEHIRVKLNKNSTKIKKSDILEYFKELKDCNALYNIVKKDFNGLPDTLDAPCSFRKYLSKYPYIRYLYIDNPNDNEMETYDLQLKEIISPMSEFNITCPSSLERISSEDSIKIVCTECYLTFRGKDLVTDVLGHFKEIHYEEPDWKCLKCNKLFPVTDLTQDGWTHTCDQ